jgi:hypothetical protein
MDATTRMHTENSFFIIIGVQFRANEHGSFVQKSKSGIKHESPVRNYRKNGSHVNKIENTPYTMSGGGVGTARVILEKELPGFFIVCV